MPALGVTLVFLAVSVGLAVRGNARFRDEERLPMQWSLAGTVNWTAPRALALGLVPALGVLVSVPLLALDPRPGQEGMVVPVAFAMGATLLAFQLLHFRLIGRTLDRPRR